MKRETGESDLHAPPHCLDKACSSRLPPAILDPATDKTQRLHWRRSPPSLSSSPSIQAGETSLCITFYENHNAADKSVDADRRESPSYPATTKVLRGLLGAAHSVHAAFICAGKIQAASTMLDLQDSASILSGVPRTRAGVPSLQQHHRGM